MPPASLLWSCEQKDYDGCFFIVACVVYFEPESEQSAVVKHESARLITFWVQSSARLDGY